MKRNALCALLLFALIFTPQIDQAEADVWALLGPVLIKELTSLWRRGNLEFMGHRCDYSVRPRFRSWELYFYGRMSCPGFSNLSVENRTKSRSKAVTRTVEAYVREATRRNLISEEDARRWLQNH